MSEYTSADVQEWLKYLFVEEVEYLKELANTLSPTSLIVNVGAGGGTSGLAFSEARPDCALITVDIQDESSPYGCLEAERTVFEKAGIGDRAGWIQIHGDSKQVARKWFEHSDLPADLVFIDGDHSYEGCKGDILGWIPNMRNGSIMAIHDYEKHLSFPGGDFIEGAPHPRSWPGVDTAVRELLVDEYEVIGRVKTLIAFRIKHEVYFDED